MHIAVAFYLWIGIFNMVVIAQFWAFANDLFTPERGRRLFPLVGIGASLGAVVGAGLTSVAFVQLGPYPLMLTAAIGLMVPIVLTVWVSRREKTSRRDAAADSADVPLDRAGGFQLVFKERYLLLIALLIVVLNLVNTLGEFLFGRMIQQQAMALAASGVGQGTSARELIGMMVGGMHTWVNVLGFLFQAFLTSRLFKYVRCSGCAVRSAARQPGQLLDDGRSSDLQHRQGREDSREQHRLLCSEHDAACLVPADEPRGEIQGEAGD